MKGLLVEVDFGTGARAGGIDRKRFPTHPDWQNIERGMEVRLVSDEAAEAFRLVEGVTVLEDEAAIDAAVADLATGDTFFVEHEALLVESIRQKGIDLTDLGPETAPADLARTLYERGALGVRRHVHQAPKARDFDRAMRSRNAAQGKGRRP